MRVEQSKDYGADELERNDSADRETHSVGRGRDTKRAAAAAAAALARKGRERRRVGSARPGLEDRRQYPPKACMPELRR